MSNLNNNNYDNNNNSDISHNSSYYLSQFSSSNDDYDEDINNAYYEQQTNSVNNDINSKFYKYSEEDFYEKDIEPQYCIPISQVLQDQPLVENFKCPICLDFLYLPETCTTCQCLIGGSCLYKWLDTKKSSNSYSFFSPKKNCPVSGCTNFKYESRLNPTIYSIMNSIKLKCHNKTCSKSLTVENYYSHNCDLQEYFC